MRSVSEILTEGLNMLRNDIINNSVAAGQKATGRTYERIRVNVPSDVRGELLVPGYISVLEDGRGPGKVPHNFEEILREWAEAKGLYFDSYYMLAKKIRDEGTRLFREGGRRDIFDTPISNFERWLLKELGKYYEFELRNDIRRWLNTK